MRVLVLGRTESLLATAEHIRASGAHELAAVITAPAAPEYSAGPTEFAALARRAGVSFLCTPRLGAEAAALIIRSGAQVGVSINWPTIITEPIDLVEHGILNAHFGDLPRYRGNAVTNWALLQGEREIVLTVHFMEPGELDSGPIAAQRRVAIGDRTTIADLNATALELIPHLFVEALDGLATGGLRPVEQSARGLEPFRCYPRLPRDGRIEWTQSPARVDALVRSLVRPYHGAYTFYRPAGGTLEKLFVWETRVVAERTHDLAVHGHVLRNDAASGDSWVAAGGGVLALRRVSHGRDGEEFAPGRSWRSIRLRLGMDVEEELFRLAGGGES